MPGSHKNTPILQHHLHDQTNAKIPEGIVKQQKGMYLGRYVSFTYSRAALMKSINAR